MFDNYLAFSLSLVIISLIWYSLGTNKRRLPPGNWFSWYSSEPLHEAIDFARSFNLYFAKMKAKNNGSAVFLAHPGLRCIVLTNHATAKFYFNADQTILDRENINRFLAVAPQPQLVKNNPLALISGTV